MHNLKLTSQDWFPSQKEIHALHGEAMRAEQAWERLLDRTYGSDACNARYDSRGTATPELARLCEAKCATYQAFRLAAWPHARRAS